MASSDDVISALRREHERLSRMLQIIDSGRWWTTKDPSHEKLTALQEHTAQIRICLDEIEQIVGGIGS